jgi:iron(III) transport system substrate-binding protein
MRHAGLLLVALLIVACAPTAPASPTAAPKAAAPAEAKPAAPAEAKPAATEEAKPAAKAEAKPAAKVDLTALYEAAKKEGKIVFYATLNQQDAAQILPKFEARYPGVKVEHVRANGEALVQRILTESRAGKVSASLFQANQNDTYSGLLLNLFEAYEPPEAVVYPADAKDSNKIWYGTRVNVEVISWNTNLVKPEEAPQTFDDLTDPKWKGKLMFDATSLTTFTALRQRKFDGDLEKTRAFYKKIAANEPQPGENSNQLSQLLAAGQNAVFLGGSNNVIENLKKGGAPVDWSKKEGVLEYTTSTLVKGAPEPNAAKLLFNWFLSEEGQQAFVDNSRVPARPGVTAPGGLMPEGMKFYVNRPEFAKDTQENLRAFNEIFGLRG